MMRYLLSMCVILSAASLHAATIGGLTVNELAPPLPGGSTTSNVEAFDTNSFSWMSSGQSVFRLNSGTWDSEVKLLQSNGGPVGNTSVSSGLEFDVSGRMYVNDFVAGKIFRSSDGVVWSLFATVDRPRTMRFNTSGDLIVIGGNNDGTETGKLWSISSAGVVSEIVATQGESFFFDTNGDIVIPRYDGTGIDKVSGGVLTNVFSFPKLSPRLFESGSLTSNGNYLLGVNTSSIAGNSSELWFVNKTTGIKTVIGTNVGDSIPVDLQLRSGAINIAGYGSLHANQLVGDIESAIGEPVPEPSTVILALIAGCLFATKRLRRRK